MTNTWLLFLAGLLLFLGCLTPNAKTSEARSNHELVQAFIDTQLPDSFMDSAYDYYLADSLYITSLKTTLYKVHSGFADGSEYILLLDEQNDEIYPIIFHHWGRYNQPLQGDLNLEIIENDARGYNIEPVNYSFIQLEIFLNRCVALQTQPVNLEAMDSVFQFYFEELLPRIKSVAELDSISKLVFQQHKDAQFKIAYSRKIELLKKKILEPGVFLYQTYYDAPFEYFEIDNAAQQTCPDCIDNEPLLHHTYNLKVLQLR